MILLVVFCFLMVYDNNEQYKSGEQNRGLILMLSGALLLLGVFTLLLLKNYRCLKKNYQENTVLNEILETYINTNQSFIYLKDENLRYLLVNKALADFYGRKVSEVIGKDVFAFADRSLPTSVKRPIFRFWPTRWWLKKN